MSSSQRRHRFADRLLAKGTLATHPCSSCNSFNVSCTTSNLSDRCEQCSRYNRSCELAAPDTELDRLEKKDQELDEEILQLNKQAFEASAKVLRLKKQKQLIRQRMRALVDREARNIAELEIDELMAEVADSLESPDLTGFSGFSQVSWDDLGRISPVPSGSE